MKTPKKQPKITPKKTYGTDEVKRYLGALSEDFQGKVAAIGEQYSGLHTKIDKVTQDIRVVHLVLGEMKEDINIIKSDAEIIKSNLNKKVDYDEFQTLVRRVSALEHKVRK